MQIVDFALNFVVECRPKRVNVDVDFDTFEGDIVDFIIVCIQMGQNSVVVDVDKMAKKVVIYI